MITSFDDETARKIFHGETLTRKEIRTLGSLNIPKAEARLQLLNQASEINLLSAASLHYHSLSGSVRYSIDADSRKSKWRITFIWEDEVRKDIQLVRIEDTHK